MRVSSTWLVASAAGNLQPVIGLQVPFLPHAESKYQSVIQHGAIASESKLCSQIGIGLIKAGGNAADAIVGTTFCVGVVAPYHGGIGGGGFALIRAPNGTYEELDFRETAPADAHEEMFKGNVVGSVYGGLASGIPGELRGLEYIHSIYGSLSWSDVIIPAIKLARYGFPVSYDLVRGMDSASKNNDFLAHNDFLTKDPTWAVDFAPNGTRLGTGDIMYRRRYADTLEVIASSGPDAFYRGILANLTIQAIQRANGTMTMKDLTDYQTISRPAVSTDYRDKYKLFSCGAPASGAVALSILQTISGYDPLSRNSSLAAHRLVEAMRFAYGQRASMGDPDFLPNMSAHEAHMLSPSHGASIRSKILDSTTQNISAYDPSGFEIHNSHGTSHISAADSSGLAFSLTTTVNLYFGSKIMVPETGIILNNGMNDFSIPGTTNAFGYVASPANYIRPGKRSLSSIAPVIVERKRKKNGKGKEKERDEEEIRGELYAVLGAAGGSRIITAVVQNVIDLLGPSLPSSISDVSTSSSPSSSSPPPSLLKTVLAQPRLHDQLLPNILRMEKDGWGSDNSDSNDDNKDNGNDGSATTLAQELREKGHEVQVVDRGYSACQAVVWEHGEEEGVEGEEDKGRGKWVAEGDPRQRDSGGCVL